MNAEKRIDDFFRRVISNSASKLYKKFFSTTDSITKRRESLYDFIFGQISLIDDRNEAQEARVSTTRNGNKILTSCQSNGEKKRNRTFKIPANSDSISNCSNILISFLWSLSCQIDCLNVSPGKTNKIFIAIPIFDIKSTSDQDMVFSLLIYEFENN